MDAHLIYGITMLFMLCMVIFLQIKFNLLADASIQESKKAYSFARTQLVWWTFIVLSAIIAIIWASGGIPTLAESTLILLGIGSLTTIAARLTDLSDYAKAEATSRIANSTEPIEALSRNQETEGFLLDILSDKDGISVHRLQAVLFNFVFGIWFIYEVWQNIHGLNSGTVAAIEHINIQLKDLAGKTPTPEIIKQIAALKASIKQLRFNDIMPVIETNNLVLLGLSASTYAALKTTENKQENVR